MMKRRLRILQLVSSFSIGGAEQLVLLLAERLDSHRFETHVSCLTTLKHKGLLPQFEQLNIPLLRLKSRRLYDLPTLRQLHSYVREQKIDLIHTHLLHADIMGSLVGRLAGIPVISTLHNIPHNYAQRRADQYWLERLATRYWATHLATVSTQLREMYIKEWRIPESRISVVHNTAQIGPFLAVPPGVPPDRPHTGPVITNVGRLNPQKAQHLLLEAAPLVLAQFPEATFLIVGKGGLESNLKQQARASGIEQQVIFTGVRQDVPDILGQSDIFVLPSRWEGLPLSAVEAMAAARPVVVTAVGGNEELVENGRSGLVVPPNDANALAAALLTLLQEPQLSQRLALAGRQRVQQLFSPERFIQQHELLYTQIGQPRLTAVPLQQQEIST